MEGPRCDGPDGGLPPRRDEPPPGCTAGRQFHLALEVDADGKPAPVTATSAVTPSRSTPTAPRAHHRSRSTPTAPRARPHHHFSGDAFEVDADGKPAPVTATSAVTPSRSTPTAPRAHHRSRSTPTAPRARPHHHFSGDAFEVDADGKPAPVTATSAVTPSRSTPTAPRAHHRSRSTPTAPRARPHHHFSGDAFEVDADGTPRPSPPPQR
ncbi:Girdin [Frankliniella fusca]|uniref:Girdin n=1 Tax=Frankliniella fusca TaxID=407009 RepID=A0AAE1LSB7_9NEOP|nr:Girdin [Frankliniella fusca]